MKPVALYPSENSDAGRIARRLARLIGTSRDFSDTTVEGSNALSMGQALDTAADAMASAIAQGFAGEATVLLSELEAEYGLGDGAGLSTADRQARLLAKVRAARAGTPQEIKRAISAFDSSVTVIENIWSDVASTDPAAVYRFGVLIATVTYADPNLLARIRATIEQMKPAHTQGVVGTASKFKTDDPNSLTDRDLLGP